MRWENKPPDLGGVRVHELPAQANTGRTQQRLICQGIGAVYNPSDKPVAAAAPLPGKSVMIRVRHISTQSGLIWVDLRMVGPATWK